MTPTNHAPMWYALRIKPQAEARADRRLSELGFTSFYAHEVRELRRHPHAKAKITITLPLLRGYALAAHDGSADWFRRLTDATWQSGADRIVKSIIGTDGIPSPIHQAAVDRLAAQSGKLRSLDPPKLSIGQRVRIASGPMADLAGRVEAVRGAKVRMMLGMMGHEKPVTVPRSLLVPIGQ